ncbi:hypothetical protein PLIIFM63780_001596 [Purpureocillium lilacinum]|uniref:Centromere protein Mis12 n=1 Tax=Purpureocillium lilacinum TaxID=33203 RepID=A0A179H0V8_PURLI|nr:centromere protein Mis12 [Purpureocillium lilacinum]GJN68224.1 hypothetical protein PLICBS_002267 [Purpureocillium lilacinum]GJN78103.1 hypothetical protein PLIIFM63780_001596 [Purpureocillium lilacinum]
MAAPAANSDYELLTEHLGYPPVALIDDIINTVNVLADRALDSVERLLLSIPPQKLGFSSSSIGGGGKKSKDLRCGTAAVFAAENDNNGQVQQQQQQQLSPEEAAKREIENGTHQLETLLNASIDKNFDLFELYTMRNILSVRPDDQPYMRLAHYDGLDFSGAGTTTIQEGQGEQGRQQGGVDPDRPTSESVTALRRRLQASQRLQAALEAERARNDVLLRRLRGVLGVRDDDDDDDAPVKTEDAGAAQGEGDDQEPASSCAPLKFLSDKGTLEDGGTDQPVTTTAEFALSQLQALRALSTSLRTLLPDLGALDDDTAAAADADDNDNEDEQAAVKGSKTWRRQRAEYIEASSRKYLERAGGLELGPRGEVRDGDWQGQGRGLGREEVEGLERAAAVLASASASAAGGGVGDDGGPSGSTRGGDDAMDES